jgi:hypothetical protein
VGVLFPSLKPKATNRKQLGREAVSGQFYEFVSSGQADDGPCLPLTGLRLIKIGGVPIAQVSRLGIVAQGVYDQPHFLVDADASRGNSGSPIFLCSSGKFAGIVFAQASDTINIIDAAKKVGARVPYGASLAACIPASVIREFLDKH